MFARQLNAALHHYSYYIQLMKTFLIVMLFLLTAAISSRAQTILVGGNPSSGKLTWDDFTGRVDKSSVHDAVTTYTYNYKYKGRKVEGDSARFEGLEIVLELDAKNSWAKKGKLTDDLLKHEQGHFNIGIMHAREVLKAMQALRFTPATYTAGLQRVINDAAKKYNAMTLQYDKETDHSKNKEQQQKWDAFFVEQKLF